MVALLATTSWLSVVGIIFGIIVGIVTLVGMIAGAIYLVRGTKVKTNNTLADQAITSMTAANAALSSRLDLVEKDNVHCMELKKQQDIIIEQQNKRIQDLREDVSQRAAVSEFRDETRGFLSAIAQKLDIRQNEHPPLAPPK